MAYTVLLLSTSIVLNSTSFCSWPIFLFLILENFEGFRLLFWNRAPLLGLLCLTWGYYCSCTVLNLDAAIPIILVPIHFSIFCPVVLMIPWYSSGLSVTSTHRWFCCLYFWAVYRKIIKHLTTEKDNIFPQWETPMTKVKDREKR